MSDEGLAKESIEAEFRGWQVFPGVDQRWHARIEGAEVPAADLGP
jgi:hypothetical protein